MRLFYKSCLHMSVSDFPDCAKNVAKAEGDFLAPIQCLNRLAVRMTTGQVIRQPIVFARRVLDGYLNKGA